MYAGTARGQDRIDVALLAGAELAIAADALQSLDIKHHPPTLGCYGCGLEETNPFTGPHPSDARLLGVAGAEMAAVALTWYVAPRWARRALPVWVICAEVLLIARNKGMGLSFSF